MQYKLSPDLRFRTFCKESPIDADSVFESIQERHAHRMTVRRAAATTENLRKIMTATFSIANKTGFASMSLRDLSRESGLSMGGLYGYIKTKDDLAAMIEDVVRHCSAAIPEWFSECTDPRLRLQGTLRAHIFMSELLHPWFFFVFMDSRTLSSAQKSVAKGADLHFHQELVRLIAAAKLASGSGVDLLAAHCLSLIQDWYVKRWKYRQLGLTVDEFADSTCKLMLGHARPA